MGDNNFIGGQMPGLPGLPDVEPEYKQGHHQGRAIRPARLSGSGQSYEGRRAIPEEMRVKQGEFNPRKLPRNRFKPIARMTDEQRAQFFSFAIAERVVTSQMVRQTVADIATIFLPIAFGALRSFHPDDIKENLAFIFAYRGQDENASSHGINGWPTFKSCRLMHREDWELILPRLKAVEEAKREQREAIRAGEFTEQWFDDAG